MNKKAQITIFMIVTVLIIASVALFFVLRSNLGKQEKYPPEVSPIANFVEECIYNSGEEVIYQVGQGGGYYYPSENSNFGITLYIINKKNYVPSKQKIEDEISHYFNENLPLCTGNFSTFLEYTIQQGKISSKTQILSDSIKLKVNYPLTIKEGEFISEINDFETEIPVKLAIIYNFAQEIENSSLESVCLNCLVEISQHLKEKDLSLEIINYDRDTMIFNIRDEQSSLNGKPFEWVFANKY